VRAGYNRYIEGSYPLFFVRVGVVLLFLLAAHLCRPMANDEPSEKSTLETLLTLTLEELIEVKISLATGTPKPIRMAPAVAAVITAEDIEKMGSTTLDEALETVPGLHVYPSFGSLVPGYTIRGIQTALNPQTLILVNGLPITTAYNGRRIAGLRIPAANISRIEVIRGPGSAIHGADAFSGTVNVITKEGREIDGVESGLRAGSFDTYGAWAQYGADRKGWDVALSLEYQESDGDSDQIVSRDLQTVLDAALNAPFGLPNASRAPDTLQTHYRCAPQSPEKDVDIPGLGLVGR